MIGDRDSCYRGIPHHSTRTNRSAWTPPDLTDDWATGTYATITAARSMDPEFRATVLSRYDRTCPLSGVDHPGLLDVAHVLPWSDYPAHRGDPSNVLALSTLHHAAVDRALFTLDADGRHRVDPGFETECAFLAETIVDRRGEVNPIIDVHVETGHFRQRNEGIAWIDQ